MIPDVHVGIPTSNGYKFSIFIGGILIAEYNSRKEASEAATKLGESLIEQSQAPFSTRWNGWLERRRNEKGAAYIINRIEKVLDSLK